MPCKLCSSRPIIYPKPRYFYPSKELSPKIHEFPSNFITTSKYTSYNFLFKSLFQQFYRYANIYFLVIAVLSSIPSISPLNPVTAVAPLIFVLALSMCREGWEDIRRHKSDREVNSSESQCLLDGKCFEKSWKDIEVGDILLIKENEPFPADLILLASSLANGMCYIQTGSLDGEKALKPKNCEPQLFELFKDLDNQPNNQQLEALKFFASVPEQSLYSFDGGLEINQKKNFLNIKQLLLRGAFLKNTKWVVALTVYTGMDTKLMKNAENSKIKTSKLERMTNLVIIIILLIQFILCSICCVFNIIYASMSIKDHWYLNQDDADNPALSGLLNYFSYFLLFNTMLPISLVVSLEFVKVFQSYFIWADDQLYVKSKDRRCKPVTTSINEELGQIEYIFSDKTGTLTCNIMEFKYCVIGNLTYGAVNRNRATPLDKDVITLDYFEANQEDINTDAQQQENELVQLGRSQSRARNVKNQLRIQNSNKQQKDLSEHFQEFWQILACCHECIIEEENGKRVYQGPSPDELALVETAKQLGYSYEGTIHGKINLKIYSELREFPLLYSFEFNSDRKRMSVIVRDPRDGKVKLYVKGADNIIKNLLKKSRDSQPFLEGINYKLDDFAKDGLRTLCIAWREISQQELKSIEAKFEEIVDAKNREQRIFELAAEIEQELFLVGCTAIEDKLQDNVPETIHDLLKAALILSDKSRSTKLVEITQKCESVVCCRVTPKQKAQVVRLIRVNLKKITLSIGDGANDVNMIQEANIGIGIYGNEGMRAVQSSDFAIGEFQGLWRLVFVHGRWNYMRNAEMILYFFYKNMIFTVPQLYFAAFCMFSAQSVFDDWYMSFYNLFFTALPILCRAIWDQDFNYQTIKVVGQRSIEQGNGFKSKIQDNNYLKFNLPKSYYKGKLGLIFTPKQFSFWVIEGVVVALVLFIVNYFIFVNGIATSEGYTTQFWGFGIALFTSIIIIVDLKIAIHTKYWWWFNWVCILPCSLGIFAIYLIISNYLTTLGNVQAIPIQLFQTLQYYASVFLCTLFIFAINFTQFFLKSFLFKDLIYYLTLYAKNAFKYGESSIQARNYQMHSTKTLNGKIIQGQTNYSHQLSSPQNQSFHGVSVVNLNASSSDFERQQLITNKQKSEIEKDENLPSQRQGQIQYYNNA